MEFADADLVAEFVIESQEGLANIEQQMLAIESAGADIDVDLVNSVFRTMHSIKGTAGFLGLSSIGTLAHGLEEVLNGLRNREIVSSSALVTSVLHAADYMKDMIDAVESSNGVDVSSYVDELHRVRHGSPSAKIEPTAIESEDSVAAVPVVAEPIVADTAAPANASSPTSIVPQELLNDMTREFIAECLENLDRMEHDLVVMEKDPNGQQLVRGIFRTMHTIKGGAGVLGLQRCERLAHTAENLLGKLRDGAIAISQASLAPLLATVDKCREGLKMLETAGNDAAFECDPLIRQLQAAEGGASAAAKNSPAVAAQAPAKTSPVVAAQSASPPAPKPAVSEPKKAAAHAEEVHADKNAAPIADSTIRVDVGLLDKLMTRIGELVLARNQIVQYTNRLEDAEFISTAQRLNLITTELQESVMKTRMQPIGNVWSKFPRVVRDLSSQLGKQVRIEMEGKETELDKTIIEAIKDPLTHLVRNSVDHGIEAPEGRAAAGKSAEGLLLLRAYHEGGQVNIEIVDDGAGLKLERIRQKAIEKGLITAEQAGRMSDREAGQLIFAPGFSTAEKVTSVSGRGVGMDVVKTNIERIGGTIDLQTRPGEGTTIRIKIPLTLAIIPALIVTNDGDRYAIPQVSLLELVRLEGDEARSGIEYVHGAPVYRLRGKLLPLVYLSERFGKRSEEAKNGFADDSHPAVNIVVLRADERHFGLIVDKVNDTEEIVVKPLGKQLKGIAEYAGATIMGDGNVALILDVKGLAVAAGMGGEIRDRGVSQEEHAADKSLGRKETVLVVDLGDDRRFALPTSMVARLEKIAATTVEHADGREVIQYRGAILPLVRLGDVFGVQPASSSEPEMQVIVYDEKDRSFGLVVEHIVDITEAELKFQVERSADDYLLGTTVVQQRVTDVLNLRNLAQFERAAARSLCRN